VNDGSSGGAAAGAGDVASRACSLDVRLAADESMASSDHIAGRRQGRETTRRRPAVYEWRFVWHAVRYAFVPEKRAAMIREKRAGLVSVPFDRRQATRFGSVLIFSIKISISNNKKTQ